MSKKKKEAVTARFDQGYWICDTCAKERGGKWPEGHVATLAVKKCGYCDGKNHGVKEAIAPWVDYNWTNKELTHIAKVRRD
jgi:predicted amidophosphoribosyltransferase